MKVEIIIPGDPVPKQSVRYAPVRYRQDGYHTCPWCNHNTYHHIGDIVPFRSPYTKKVDVTITAYQDSRYTKHVKYIKDLATQQLPAGFQMFSKRVHVVQVEFVFSPLTSFSKKVMGFLQIGGVYEKTTKPDLHDNLKKLVYDALSGVVWADDGLISREFESIKRYGIKPYTRIVIDGE